MPTVESKQITRPDRTSEAQNLRTRAPGVSGDTACADHAIAYRMRAQAGLAVNLPNSDNIQYLDVGELPHDLKHPHCKVPVTGDVTP